MNKKVFIGIVIAGLLVVTGIAGYVLRPTPEASVPLEAIPVDRESSGPETTADSEPAGDQETKTVDVQEESPATAPGTVVFVILQEKSEVRFKLDEVLRGAPKTVIGVTNQVAGEIAVDFEKPANSKVGAILINARTFTTDNDFRNRAINNEILDTGTYEFITFTPTGISGFPEGAQFGEPITFQLTGDLTIRDITHQATFEMTVTAVSENQLQGYGSTIVARADYDLRIPNVPNVANVDEEVLLEIEFVAAVTQ